MAGDDKKVVWILGAGFSVPLGGPLFRALISDQTREALLNWEDFTRQRWTCEVPDGRGGLDGFRTSAGVSAKIIQKLYQVGLNDQAGAIRVWEDAEQFLERLEIAGGDDSGSLLVKDIKGRLGLTAGSNPDEAHSRALKCFGGEDGLKALHREGVRFVAGACTQFLWRAEGNPAIVDRSEQWDPYRRWFDSLHPGHDSVITFNYDRALDLLSESGGRRSHNRDLFFSPVGPSADYFNEHCRSCVPVYHLHGHVGWRTDLTGEKIVQGKTDRSGRANLPIAHEDPEFAVIGVPGQSKLTWPETLLKDVWDRATKAIASADAVVFVGYRFPETDNMAKRVLLKALRVRPKAMVHVVLGAHNQDTPRLQGMIDWTRRGSNSATVHQMKTQDFFAVFDRSGLLG